jgi:hypothetical protein
MEGMIASNPITTTPTMTTPVIKSWMMFIINLAAPTCVKHLPHFGVC